MLKINKSAIGYLAIAFLIVGLASGCSDFLENPVVQKDPNRAIEVQADLLFQGIQIGQFFMQEGGLTRTFSIWLQQMSGTDRQLLGYSKYEITEDDHDVEFNNVYTGGGLIDIRALIAQTTESNWIGYRGIVKVHEALLIGTAASIWGDIPYSEAVNPDIETPKLDSQKSVYDALQTLLDGAIADLQDGSGYLPPNDFVYGTDLAKWIAAAHSLKARLYMHWAETDPGNYARALTEAQQGIASIDGSMLTMHSTVENESNVWYQFYRERDSYIRAGKFLVDLLKDRNDPRLPIYFAPDVSGGFSGAAPGEGNPNVSSLSAIFLAKDHSYDILTYEETELIIAEAAFMTGDEATARDALNRAMAGIEFKWNLDLNSLPRYDATVTGQALMEAICEEKYIAMFLNIEAYNDWKRTKRPILVPFGGGDPETSIPHRIPYSDNERQTNPNIPPPAQQPLRNANDPS
jgi:hypothetical protein